VVAQGDQPRLYHGNVVVVARAVKRPDVARLASPDVEDVDPALAGRLAPVEVPVHLGGVGVAAGEGDLGPADVREPGDRLKVVGLVDVLLPLGRHGPEQSNGCEEPGKNEARESRDHAPRFCA
jgi:hypothetical protein